VEESIAFKYRAFLSYSHRDKRWAEWLHRALENFHIDKDLVGRNTPAGPVPKSLRPVFRDREDFSAGHSLTAQTLAALEASQFLVVICSPNAAASPYVNEEIRRFKALGRADRVIPVIVDGEPGHPESECFPPALRFELGPDGTLTDRQEEPIAADAREHGDGKDVAKQKVAAGLLGVGLDEMVRRAERARRRRNRLWAALAGTFLVLAVVASGSAVYAYQKLTESEERLDQAIEIAYGFVTEATSMSDRTGVPVEVTLGLLRRADAALNRLMERGADTFKLRHRRALMLLGFSDSYRLLGHIDDWTSRARDAQALLVALTGREPANLAWRRDLADADEMLGDALLAKGMLDDAIANYRKTLPVRKQIVEAEPDNRSLRRAMWLSNEKLSDSLWKLGDRREALVLLHDALTFGLQIAEAHPRITESARARSLISLSKSSLYLAKTRWLMYGPNLSVRASLRAGLTMLCADFAGGELGRDFALFSEIHADNSRAEGGYAEALQGYRNGLASLKELLGKERSNVILQRDLARTYDKIGDVLVDVSKPAEALEHYHAGLAIRERLTAGDPSNVLWQAELLESHWRLAQHGDNPAQRWSLIVATLRKLKTENKLTADQTGLLPEAETQLAKHQAR
jgi:tetratricopeptide (TPR) repeat protein